MYNNSPLRAVLRAWSSRAITCTGVDKRLELVPVQCLHVHRPWASEAAHQTLARLEAATCSAACSLNPVIAAPCDKMAVVHNVWLAGLELFNSKQKAQQHRTVWVDLWELVHRAKARKPDNSLIRDTVEKSVLPGNKALLRP